MSDYCVEPAPRRILIRPAHYLGCSTRRLQLARDRADKRGAALRRLHRQAFGRSQNERGLSEAFPPEATHQIRDTAARWIGTAAAQKGLHQPEGLSGLESVYWQGQPNRCAAEYCAVLGTC